MLGAAGHTFVITLVWILTRVSEFPKKTMCGAGCRSKFSTIDGMALMCFRSNDNLSSTARMPNSTELNTSTMATIIFSSELEVNELMCSGCWEKDQHQKEVGIDGC